MSNYPEVYDRAAPIFENWQAWFDPSVPDEEAYPSDLIHPYDQAIADMEAGLTYWHHPGWISDIATIFEDWAYHGNLIRARLTAEWLLTTLPDDPLDDEFTGKLNLIARDQFCEAYQGESCPWPKLPEFYASSLNWQMVGPAKDWLMKVAPSAFEWY